MPSSLSPAARIIAEHYALNTSLPTKLTPPSSPPTDSPARPFTTIRALSRAPFVHSYSRPDSFLFSGEEFFEENPLIAATLQPQTQQKYSIALDNFALSDAATDPAPLSMDQRLSIYIQARFYLDERAGQRKEMSNLICMLLLMYPSLRQDMGLARRCISGWKALKPAKAAAPFTKQLVMAFAWHLLTKGRGNSATALLLTYYGCLRVSEALRLRWTEVALPGDIRLSSYEPGIAGLNIIDSKTARYTGKMQFVKLDADSAVIYLTALNRAPHNFKAKVADVPYQLYTTHIKEAAQHFGFPPDVFTSHSARIGKATEDFISGVPVAQIAIQGRWKSLNSLRYYLNNGKARLLPNSVSITHQTHIADAAQSLQQLIAHYKRDQLQ